MSSSRKTAGRSNHMDERRHVERNGGIHFKVTRKDKEYMMQNCIADIAIFISYPIITRNQSLEYEVQHDDDEQIYVYQHQDLVEDGYSYTLAKLILSKKNPNQSTLQSWIDNHTVEVTHVLNIGCAVWIKFPSEDTIKDRVCLISGYYNDGVKTLDFLQIVIPKYYIKHIDHSDEELQTQSLTISTHLKNGTVLVNGGKGIASDSDLICLSSAFDTPKCAYLKIQIFLIKNILQKYKSHVKIIGQQAKDRVARVLQSFLSTKYEDKAKFAYIDMMKELKQKEFDSQLKTATGNAPNWTGTKNKKKLEIEYDNSIAAFGRDAIVRTFVVRNSTNFILSNTDIKFTYYPNQGRLRIDSFVSHVWM
eukprot:171354_1